MRPSTIPFVSRRTALITGSSGLIGSEAVLFLDERGWLVHGIDNNMRRDFFGPDGDTKPTLDRLPRWLPNGSSPRRCRAPRIPRVPRACDRRRAHVPSLRLQGQASSGQHPLLRRLYRSDGVLRAPSVRRRLHLGGGRENSISLLEAAARLEELMDKPREREICRGAASRRSHLLRQRRAALPERLPRMGDLRAGQRHTAPARRSHSRSAVSDGGAKPAASKVLLRITFQS
jgi:hypothetical protein